MQQGWDWKAHCCSIVCSRINELISVTTKNKTKHKIITLEWKNQIETPTKPKGIQSTLGKTLIEIDIPWGLGNAGSHTTNE